MGVFELINRNNQCSRVIEEARKTKISWATAHWVLEDSFLRRLATMTSPAKFLTRMMLSEYSKEGNLGADFFLCPCPAALNAPSRRDD